MTLTESECKAKTVSTLKSMCTKRGIPKPPGKSVSEDTLVEVCCTADVMELGNMFSKKNKNKIVRKIDPAIDPNGKKFFVSDKDDPYDATYVYCRDPWWSDKSQKSGDVKLTIGNFYGGNCDIIKCTKEGCDPKEHKDAVTIKAYQLGRTLMIGSNVKSDLFQARKSALNSL